MKKNFPNKRKKKNQDVKKHINMANGEILVLLMQPLFSYLSTSKDVLHALYLLFYINVYNA